MSFSNLLKQLKKKLRVKKRWLSLGVIMLLAGSVALLARASGVTVDNGRTDVQLASLNTMAKADDPSSQTEELLKQLDAADHPWDVEVSVVYICGEETTRVGPLTVDEIRQYRQEHPAAELSLDDELVRFTEKVEDLSPKCKEDAYFGLDKSGNLSLFHDVPEKEQIIRTFYQLNLERMRSSLPPDTLEELHHGIRITDLAEFNSVLSTFGEYALDEARS